MPKPTKREKKQIIEIHIYVHQQSINPNGAGYFSQRTCGQKGTTTPYCPTHTKIYNDLLIIIHLPIKR